VVDFSAPTASANNIKIDASTIPAKAIVELSLYLSFNMEGLLSTGFSGWQSKSLSSDPAAQQ
jgi:hypothetical protein